MFDLARIVGVFQDDEHPETHAVGITNEDGNALLLEEDDPEVIIAMAQRLVMFADEIEANRRRNIDKVIDMFKGYPEGTTLGQILDGSAKKIVTAVEND
ncbi:hypothetical protein [Leucobacter tenebrionis]|uniref:hypothetical protein n=1 Tax=Leucobacter tenebrionis TaxID=2873270 RepID=UPI001CA6A7C2|nr:hypothetical protein [Leucobacter tenebrionis]QZY52714.1 hypothetical protein KVY00_04500 [Leucobacter tenebrionis]